MDCQDFREKSSHSRPVTILVGDPKKPAKAYCTKDGWTVIQSRGQFGNPKDYFSVKQWQDYKNGFGEPGFEIIYSLFSVSLSLVPIIVKIFFYKQKALRYKHIELDFQYCVGPRAFFSQLKTISNWVLGKEHWVGLRTIYWLTQQKNYKLRVSMKAFNEERKTATYSTFKLTENVKFLFQIFYCLLH